MRRGSKINLVILAMFFLILCGHPVWGSAKMDKPDAPDLAVETGETAPDILPEKESLREVPGGGRVYMNPEYMGEIPTLGPEDFSAQKSDAVTVEEVFTSPEEAGKALREPLKKRAGSIVIHYRTEIVDYYSGLMNDIWDEALRHTGNSTEGDYIRNQYGGVDFDLDAVVNGRWYELTLTYTVQYYTSSEQEAALDREISRVMTDLRLNGKSEYEKTKAIYDYICSHVTYDYENLDNKEYMRKYTAYAALIDGTAVCQGYAVLFYRMALEAGLHVRKVDGLTEEGNEDSGHAWNIVQIGGWYYNLDTTWDAGRTEAGYQWFLRCPENFTSHYRRERYSEEKFNLRYPMGSRDYAPTGGEERPVLGRCGTALTWTLSGDGVLSIWGSGGMDDYSNEQPAPWTGLSVRRVVFGEGVTRIGNHAFCFQEALSGVSLPQSMEEIGSFAFAWCRSLADIDFPKGLVGIGENAFYACEAIRTLTIPEGVKNVGAAAFAGLSGLEELTLSDGVSHLGELAFSDCRKLARVSFPLSAADAKSNIFRTCESLTELTLTGNGALPDYASDRLSPWNRTSVKSLSLGTGISGIGDYAFYKMEGIDRVLVPGSIKEVGAYAFAYDNGIAKVTLESGVSRLGDFVFYGCGSLEDASLPCTLKDVAAGAFGGCRKLNHMEVTGKGAMPDYAGKTRAWQTDSVTTVTVAEGITEVGKHAFYNADNLTNVVLPQSLRTIRAEAFAYSDGLKTIKLPKKLKKIGDKAFYVCKNLGTAQLPDGVTAIGKQAFAYDKKLKKIELPKNLKKIAEKTFYDCEGLSSALIGNDGMTAIGKEAFAFCKKLGKLTVPAAVASIGKGAFTGCGKLRLYGYESTAIQKFASANKLSFHSLGFVPPGVKSAVNTASGIRITWQRSPGAKGYRLYRKTSGSWKKLADIGKGSTVSYTDATVKSGKKYTYRLRVYNKGKAASDYGKAASGTMYLSRPVIKTAKAAGKGAVKVTWKREKAAGGYELRIKCGGNKKTVKIGKGSTVSRKITGLTKNKTYEISIRSYKASGKSTWYSAWSKAKKIKIRK